MTLASCVLCGKAARDPASASVPSNVRAHRHERFAVWRCPSCHGLHARDEVDLDHYYADYPFYRLACLDDFHRKVYANLWRRVTNAVPIDADSAVLDYGCGSGHFVEFLREAGVKATGYDAYAPGFDDPERLSGRYECVVSQDVLEHVPDPNALLDTWGRLVRPGGALVIGTPNADAIDLDAPDDFLHQLHQPYHRHIVGARWLRDAGTSRGWTVAAYHPSAYVNTRHPFINQPFLMRVLRSRDNTLDAAFEDPGPPPWSFWSLGAVRDALWGARRAPASDVMFVFRVPGP